MELTAAANWLNTIFASFDYGILQMYHNLAVSTDGKLNVFFETYSLYGKHGLGAIFTLLILLLFAKTRKTGVWSLMTMVVSYIIGVVLLKNLIMRPRPFNEATGMFVDWWKFAGSSFESGFSFPSGHTVAMTSLCLPFFFEGNKKRSWIALLLIAVMMASRNYLMVHYPTDVIAGFLITCAFTAILKPVRDRFYDTLETNKEDKVCNALLNWSLFSGKKSQK